MSGVLDVKIRDLFGYVAGTDTIKSIFNRINISESTAKFELKPDGSNTKTTMNPNAADGTTAYILDTENEQTSGNLFNLLNDGASKFSIDYTGGITAASLTSPQLYVDYIDNTSNDHGVRLTFATSGLTLSHDQATGKPLIVNQVDATNTDGVFELQVNSVAKTTMNPNAGATDTPYVLDTEITHTGGNLFDVKNNGKIYFNVRKDGVTDIKNDINLYENADDTDAMALELRKSRGTYDTPTVITSGDYLGEIVGYGHDGTDYTRSSSIRFKSAGTIGSNQVPSKIEFYTSTDASPSVETLVGSIDQSGILQITSIGETGTRIANGFFTDLAVTNTITGSVSGNAATVTNGVYTTDTGTVTAKMLQNVALDLGAADISVNLSNSNGSYVTNLTIDGDYAGDSAVFSGTVESGKLTISGTTTSDGYFEAVTTKTADYTATTSDSLIIADGTSNTVTITLPTAVGITGRLYRIKCVDDTYQVDVSTTSSQAIDGSLTKTLAQWDCLNVISDGSDWMVI
jgi:hypothetical protein